MRDTVVLVDFWATWCIPCRKELPHLVALEHRLRSRQFRLITVSADDSADAHAAAQFLDSLGVSHPWYIKQAGKDAEFINAIDSTWSGALPALFVYDKRGRRAGKFIGETPDSTITNAIIHLLDAPSP
jgi:thiol-disulfide isomerase/thioredoxin